MSTWKDKEEFKARVREWAKKLEIEVKTISIREMKNKWASYTQRNDLLIFNTELLNMDRELGDYVIVHELLHFRVPNHGKLWKTLMRVHLGNYEEVENHLKKLASKSLD
jgi:predicted metal-dependent hydrolase